MNHDEEEMRKALQAFECLPDSDDIRYKNKIKDILLNNRFIIHVLNNKELEEDVPEDYFGTNILPYYLVSPSQTDTQNFICFETQFDEEARYNEIVKYGQIRFYILCHQKDIIEENTGISRHDLLAAIILDQFNWTNCFGNQIHCISDVPSVVDTNYACRTLIFEGKFPNSIVKNKLQSNSYERDNQRVINSDVIIG